MTPTEFFWAHVEQDDFGCWIWTGRKTADQNGRGGYGLLRVGGKPVLAHRFAFELFEGPIPHLLEVDHLCRVHACSNPGHLELVTHAENIRRGDLSAIGQYLRDRTHCPEGHEYDEANTAYVTNRRGSVYRRCKRCQRDKARAWRKRNKKEALRDG